jgi:DNA-binding response OmpR family regulator
MSSTEELRGTETVLLVEDNDEARDALRRILEWHGYRVVAAADASQAEGVFESHRGTVDLLVADVILPGRTGVDLARGLLLRDPTLRVLFLSGYADGETPARELGSHVAGFLQKPVTIRQLAEKVRTILDNART